MSKNTKHISCEQFVEYAEFCPHLWDAAVGQIVHHQSLGEGEITSIDRGNNPLLIHVRFSGQVESNRFHGKTFPQYFFSFHAGDALNAQIEKCKADLLQKKAEEKRQAEERAKEALHQQAEKKRLAETRAAMIEAYEKLAPQYNLSKSDLVAKNGPTPLAFVLKRLDDGELLDGETDAVRLALALHKLVNGKPLNDDEIAYLEEDVPYGDTARFAAQATYFLQRYQSNKNWWDLSKSSSAWRKANQPERAIMATAILDEIDGDELADKKAVGAVLTSRGGAHRDLGSLQEAKNCANRALSLSITYYPHNLLGAILFAELDFDAGQRHFDEAKKLGATEREQDSAIREAIKKANSNAKKAIVDHLQKEDPQRYHWAEALLDSPRAYSHAANSNTLSESDDSDDDIHF